MAEKEPIGVIGVGWVGLCTAACFAELGHRVYARDILPAKVESLARGEVPMHEPGLQALVRRNAERLTFTTDMGLLLDNAELLFCCVDTPPTYSGDADLSSVEAVLAEVGESDRHAIVMKSTVPAGTGRSIQRRSNGLGYVSNPEFLKEGTAVEDFMRPDRVVVGVGAESERFADRVLALYEPLGALAVRTDVASAEMIKLASNAFLATKISFINEIANVSEELGADVNEVARGMGLDDRIGPKFLRAGIGWGGSCLIGGESVLVRQRGRTTLLSLERLWERLLEEDRETQDGVIEPSDLELLSWTPECDAPRFMPVMAATRRDFIGDLVDVRTKMGRRISCTPDHPWVVSDGAGGDPEVLLAKELTTADWVPLAGARPEGDAIERLPLEAAVEAAGVAAAAVVVRPPVAAVQATVARPLGERRPFSTVRNGRHLSTELELEPTLDAAFWRGVGLCLAEGYEQRLPDLVWDRCDEHKWALLSGLFEGDGSWRLVGGGPSVTIDFGAVSGELADGVLRLLGDLGVVGSLLRTARTAKHWITISGADQVERAIALVPERDRAGVRASVARQRKRIAPTGYRRPAAGHTWARIVSTGRRAFSGPVYSLEVLGAHTFVTTHGVVTHNCFGKDVAALKQLAGNSGYHFQLLTAVIEVNDLQKRRTVGKLQKHLGSLVGKTVALLGIAFKPDTDDIRDATSLVLAGRLLGEGATVRAYDPVAMEVAGAVLKGAQLCETALDALDGAHAAVLVTEWPEFGELDWAGEVKARMANPLVVDGRNFLDREALKAAGYAYEGIGR